MVGNLLLVLGFVLLVARPGAIGTAPPAFVSLGTVLLAVLVLLVAAVPGFHGDPDLHSLASVLPATGDRTAIGTNRGQQTLPAAAAKVACRRAGPGRRLVASTGTLSYSSKPPSTAFVTETLVGSLEDFARQVHLSEFFVAVVIVAIVGNVPARKRGSSCATRPAPARDGDRRGVGQPGGGFLIPAVVILSWTIEPLALSMRPIELASMGAAALLAARALLPSRPSRAAGALLVGGYAILVVAFYLAGNR